MGGKKKKRGNGQEKGCFFPENWGREISYEDGNLTKVAALLGQMLALSTVSSGGQGWESLTQT